MTVTNIENTARPLPAVPSTFSFYNFPLKQETSSSSAVSSEDDVNSDSMIGVMDECYTSSSSLPPVATSTTAAAQLKEEINHCLSAQAPASKLWEQSTQLFTTAAKQEPSSATVKRKNSRRPSTKNNNHHNIDSTSHVMGSVSKQNKQSLLCSSPTTSGNSSMEATTTPKSSSCRQQNCSNCHADKTPLWRKGADGNTLCNKCGLYWSRHGKHRPIKLDRSTRKPPSRKNSSTESPTKTSYNETPHTPKLKKKSPGVSTKRVHSPSTPTKTSKRVKKSIDTSKSPNPSSNDEDSALPSYLSSSSLSSSDEDEQACFEHFLQQNMPGFNNVPFMDTQLGLNQTAASIVQAMPTVMSSPSFISAGTNQNDINTISGIGNSNGANSMFGESGDASILNTILFQSNSDIAGPSNTNTFLQLMQQSYQQQQQIIQQQQQQLFEQTHAVTNIPGGNAVDLMGNQNAYPMNFNILFDNNSFGSIEEHDMIFSTPMEDIVDMNQFSSVDNNRQLLVNNVSLDPNCISMNNNSSSADQLNTSNSYLSF